MNLARGFKRVLVVATLVWVANYCQANPLDKLIDAAKALERELEKRSDAKR